MLFVQGSRDAFGTPDELTPIVSALRPASTLHVVAQGDHSFKLSRKDPAAQAALYANFSGSSQGLDTFSSMTSPSCENPWRQIERHAPW